MKITSYRFASLPETTYYALDCENERCSAQIGHVTLENDIGHLEYQADLEFWQKDSRGRWMCRSCVKDVWAQSCC